MPDWNVTFSRSDSTASTQSKKLADIRARIKKKGKGYVVRLLKGSTADNDEVAEVDLGQHSPGAATASTHELDSSSSRAELDSSQAIFEPEGDTAERHDVYEIGTSNEPGISPSPSTLNHASSPTSTLPQIQINKRFTAVKSIPEEALSDAETLISDARPIGGRMEEDQTDVDTFSTSRFTHPVRSTSVSSIVKTPTRGLSVVGPVRRGKKISRARSKNKSVHLDLKRSDAHKSVKRRSPHNSISSLTNGVSHGEPRAEPSFLRERVSSFSRGTRGHDTWSNEFTSMKATKPRHNRRSSADDLSIFPEQRAKLLLQTNVPRPKSTNVSPAVRRRRSSKKHLPMSSSSISLSSTDSDERRYPSPEWSEVDPSDELRAALGRAFRAVAPPGNDIEDFGEEKVLPRIIEPTNEGYIGEIPLPPEVEIRSYPITIQNTTLKYWGLAVRALSEKVKEGFDTLRDIYGAEPPVPPGQVRVRWTCVRYV